MDQVRVFAPASVANLAVGYDILGLAIESPGDEVVVKTGTTPGLKITSITGDGGKLPYDVEKNTAGFAALQFLRSIGKEQLPIEMEIHKKMAMGTGLGSSAASAVAGVYGVSAYLGHPVEKIDLLKFCVEGEQKADGAYHADNVGPSLLGGIILIRSNESLEITQVPVPDDLHLAMIYPHIEVLTSESRAILSDTVSLDDMIAQTGNIATFIAGCYESDYDKISQSLTDVIIEPQRAHLISGFYDYKEIAMKNGALGFSISGAGPSMFALCRGQDTAEKILSQFDKYSQDNNIKSDIFTSKINTEGARVID